MNPGTYISKLNQKGNDQYEALPLFYLNLDIQCYAFIQLLFMQEAKFARKMQLEKKMIGLPEDRKKEIRQKLEHEEVQISKESRKKVTTADFESLAVIGRGAFGEVRLVRRKPSGGSSQDNKIYALKSMKKEMMVVKNQVGHVKAERDVLATADESNKWLTVLHYSFTDETHLYMVMEYLAGGDLMSLLMKEDTL